MLRFCFVVAATVAAIAVCQIAQACKLQAAPVAAAPGGSASPSASASGGGAAPVGFFARQGAARQAAEAVRQAGRNGAPVAIAIGGGGRPRGGRSGIRGDTSGGRRQYVGVQFRVEWFGWRCGAAAATGVHRAAGARAGLACACRFGWFRWRVVKFVVEGRLMKIFAAVTALALSLVAVAAMTWLAWSLGFAEGRLEGFWEGRTSMKSTQSE